MPGYYNYNYITHGFKKSMQNHWIKGRKLNHNCCRIKAK